MYKLLLHEIKVRRGAIIGWTIGLSFFSIMYMSFYPALPPEFLDFPIEEIEIYRAMGVMSMVTFEGYMLSTVWNFLALLAGIFGIVIGIGALAGEEDSGTLELLASLPLSRLQLFLAKAAALVMVVLLVMVLVGVAVVVAFVAIQDQFETFITAADLFLVTLSHWLITYVFAALSLFIGAYFPNRRAGLSAAFAILVLAFFGNNLAGLVPSLEPLQPFMPFYYFDQVLGVFVGDAAWGDALVLLVMAVGFLLLGMISFQKRNLTVGVWPWQRARLP
jgi:ABC-2 type transport system permease protein